MDRWALEYPGDVADLEARARRELADAERDGPPGQPGGADATNSIWVTVDADYKVESIEISRRWKDQVDAAQFGPALFEAYTDALAKSLHRRAIRDLTNADGDNGRPPPELPPWPDPEDPAWFRDLQANVEQLDAELDAARRMAERGTRVDEHDRELRSPNEIFTMRLQGPTVVGITGDIMQIRRADAESLRLEALDLFRAADLTSTN